MNDINLVDHLKGYALSIGFTLFGIAQAKPSPHLDAYLHWIESGMHGEMEYLAREDRLARRQNLDEILPGARSLIMVGLNYATSLPPKTSANDPARGRISNYALGADYHDVMLSRLAKLGKMLARETGRETTWRAHVDTGAILERLHAVDAGLGFIGKNTMLINPRYGSYLFLGEIITDLELPTIPLPQMPGCGSCTRCSKACPTNALIQPYVLDARRCISYLTMELKRWIPHELRPLMGKWVYGCDVCQQVCPWQRFALPTNEEAFYPSSDDRVVPLLADLLALDEAAFEKRYKGTPIYRIKRERLVRNACVAAGNSRLPDMNDLLTPLLHDASTIVRGHAAWAVGQFGDSRDALHAALITESEDTVRREIRYTLESIQE